MAFFATTQPKTFHILFTFPKFITFGILFQPVRLFRNRLTRTLSFSSIAASRRARFFLFLVKFLDVLFSLPFFSRPLAPHQIVHHGLR